MNYSDRHVQFGKRTDYAHTHTHTHTLYETFLRVKITSIRNVCVMSDNFNAAGIFTTGYL